MVLGTGDVRPRETLEDGRERPRSGIGHRCYLTRAEVNLLTNVPSAVHLPIQQATVEISRAITNSGPQPGPNCTRPTWTVCVLFPAFQYNPKNKETEINPTTQSSITATVRHFVRLDYVCPGRVPQRNAVHVDGGFSMFRALHAAHTNPVPRVWGMIHAFGA